MSTPVLPGRGPLAIAALCSALLLAGCATPTARQDTGSPYYAVPAGASLQLNRAVQIRPTTTRTWIQNGEVVAGYDRYAPNCSLEVRKRDDASVQTVQPGRFNIRRTQFVREQVVRHAGPTLFAALGLHLADASVDSSGPGMVYEGYHLWLESAEQPNVMRLTCRGVYDDPANARPPSIDEIRAALGSVATLTLP